MRTRFVFNPISGRPRRNAPILPVLRSFIAARGLSADIMTTRGPGHATELAKDAVMRGYDRVIAVGGDGTANEVAQALIGTSTAMGLIPCGSGNGLALHLGMPKPLDLLLEIAVSPKARIVDMDTGTANGIPFINAMGLGLDAEVGRRFNLLARRGLPAYAATALKAFVERRNERCFVTSRGHRETMDILLVAVANSDQYGNNARIAPDARVDDGMLDLVAVGPVGPVSACFLGIRLFTGTFDGSPHVRRLRGTHFTIERPSAGVIHTDGETHETCSPIEVRVYPRSLRFVVPADCLAVATSDVPANPGFALQLP